jgi:hypothetical protein
MMRFAGIGPAPTDDGGSHRHHSQNGCPGIPEADGESPLPGGFISLPIRDIGRPQSLASAAFDGLHCHGSQTENTLSMAQTLQSPDHNDGRKDR